jgi:TrmH family RNA methyltransferase
LKHIESRANPLFKQLFKWQSSAGRRNEPVLLDGLHLCEAWLEHGHMPKIAIFDLSRLDTPALGQLADKIPNELCVTMPPGLLAGLSDVQTDQGVIFVVESPVWTMPKKFEESIVILDRLQDPGNVGTLLRTCAGAGIKRVVAGKGTAALWSPKVLRSAQGAHFALKLYEQVDLSEFIENLKLPLLATTLNGGEDLYDVSIPETCAWVFGHEGQGVAREILSEAKIRIFINHDKTAIESLNVAMAAAICLFEQRRQHRSKKSV